MEENQKKSKKVDVLMQTKYHWGAFLLPTTLSLLGIVSLFQSKNNIGILLLLFGIVMALSFYLLFYSKIKFILTPNKVYVFNGKEKKVTINLARGELINYKYEESFLSNIFGYNHITLFVLINGKKKVLQYLFVKNGKIFLLKSFKRSEDYLVKLDPNYVRKLNFENNNLTDSSDENGIDRVV